MAGPDEAFRGWPAQALQFYEGLEADNSKTYWAAHQQVYDEMVLGPMTALLAELKPSSVRAKCSGPIEMSDSAQTSRPTSFTSGPLLV